MSFRGLVTIIVILFACMSNLDAGYINFFKGEYGSWNSARICTSYNTSSTCESQVSNSTPSCPTMDVELLDYNNQEELNEKEILVCKVGGQIQICICAGQLPGSIIKFEYDATADKCYNPYT